LGDLQGQEKNQTPTKKKTPAAIQDGDIVTELKKQVINIGPTGDRGLYAILGNGIL